MATIDDLRTLGYRIGIAWGDVEVEEIALAAAQALAAPEAIAADAQQVTNATIADLDAAGALPNVPQERAALAAQIAGAALERLTAARDERVDFHQRAVDIAREMATVWHVEQAAETGEIVYAGYVPAKEDGTGWDDDAQALIDALADPDEYAARAAAADTPVG